VLEIMMLIIIR